MRRALTLAAALLMVTAAVASAETGYSGSITFVRSGLDTSGKTSAVYVFNTVDFRRGAVRASMTVPLIAQQTPATAPLASVPGSTIWNRGLGDPMARVEVSFGGQRPGSVAASVSSMVKFPAGDVDNGLGSGEFDAAVGLTLSGGRGRDSVLVDVTYWVLGDPPGLAQRNVASLYVGYARVLGSSYRWSAMAAVASATSIIAGLPPPTQVSVGVFRTLRSGMGLGGIASVGLTDTAADFTIGATWRVVF